MAALLVILAASGSLLIGAWIGLRGLLGRLGEGLLVAGAGGALIVSATMELIEPALEVLGLPFVALSVVLGATLFSAADAWTDHHMGGAGGLGLALAVTFDGVPENLALGTTLLETGPLGAAALAGSILLSNLPEAAGGAAAMREDGRSARWVLGLWAGVAALLTLAALGGQWALADADPEAMAALEAFAAGAIVASLATEVFPKAGRAGPHAAGAAVAAGVVVALALSELGP